MRKPEDEGSDSEESSSMVTSTSATETTSDDDSSSVTDSETSSYTSESTSQMYTSESDLDAEEAAANEKAKKGGVSSDPFKKRVPASFYEKEKKKFSPLPKNWEVGQAGKKFFYVDHGTKTTTWVDPRTKNTRTHDIMKCKMGELPYGWEEDVDSEIGVYYIDHNTQSTYLDPPWDPRIQFQVRALQSFLADQIEMYKQKIAEMSTAAEILEKEKENELDALNDEKARLQREIDELRRKAEESSEEELTTESESDDEVKVPATLEEFQDRLKDLMRLQKMLQPSEGTNEVDEYKKTQEEIDRVKKLLDDEEEARRKILEEMERLKGQLNENMAVPEDTFIVPQDEPLLRPVEDAEFIASNPARKAQLTRRTRYEMQMELLLLKKRLEAEKIQNQALASLQGKATDREGALPMWIKKMNDIASSSKTLRMKIVMKQKSGGEQLSFRERMLFFTTNIVENKSNNGAPIIPPPPRKKLN